MHATKNLINIKSYIYTYYNINIDRWSSDEAHMRDVMHAQPPNPISLGGPDRVGRL